ncbi:MAG: hypothetical protein EOM07_11245, partial [Clostridia bacterium]|nr:hypothetical protein [Clostridia bacterium]
MFTKIEIPSSWKEEYTKYPNGKTIWEALSAAMTSFNDFVDEVNVDVQEGLLSIDQAEDTLRSELSAAFDSMSEDFQMDFSALQDEVDAAVASVADKVTQAQLDAVNAQLAEMTQDLIIPPEKTNFVTKEYETFDTQAIPFSNSGQKISYLTGVMSADVNKSSTDKIDLANMTHLYRYYGDGSTTTKFSDSIVAFYDASQVFISGLNRRTAYDLTLFEGKNVIIYPIPTGAKYVAFTVDMVNVANFNHAIRRGVDSAIII